MNADYTCGPQHRCSSGMETGCDPLKGSKVNTYAAQTRVYLLFIMAPVNLSIANLILTSISQRGIRMIKAKGSKLDRTSLGRRRVVIVAACDVKLLLS